MVLYTNQPLDLVLYRPERAAYEYRRVHNSVLEGVCGADGSFSVSRLISTDPRMYLDPRYAPGATLDSRSGPQAGPTNPTT